jgi:hypothetical protein
MVLETDGRSIQPLVSAKSTVVPKDYKIESMSGATWIIDEDLQLLNLQRHFGNK